MTVHWERRQYTKGQLAAAVKASTSWRGVSRLLGLNDRGGNHAALREAAAELGLNTSHFTGRGWNVGDKFGLSRRNTIPMSDILIVNSTYKHRSNLRKRLIKEGYLDNRCYAPFCPVPNPTVDPFTGEPKELSLSLDHINGVSNDNRIDNLRLLCYHCHAETETWCGRNRSSS